MKPFSKNHLFYFVRENAMKLFGKNIDKEVVIVAEIGVNHEGSFRNAKKLIRLACKNGADAVKLQSYTPERFISVSDKKKFERVKKFSLNKKDHLKLIEYSKEVGIRLFSTPVTEDWLEFLNIHTSVIKIASGDITFEPLVRGAASLNKPVIMSTGAANEKEIFQAIKWFKNEIGTKDIYNRLILLHCVSAYPTPISETNLLTIKYLKEKTNLRIGYSNHTEGLLASLSAIALGASLVEVHFTDTRKGKTFHDHQISLNPDELKFLVDCAPKIKSSLGVYDKIISKSEKGNVLKIRKGIIAAKNITIGKRIRKDDIMFARPASKMSSIFYRKILGKKCMHDYKIGEQISYDSFKL